MARVKVTVYQCQQMKAYLEEKLQYCLNLTKFKLLCRSKGVSILVFLIHSSLLKVLFIFYAIKE